MSKIFLGYMIIATLELLILPVETWLHNNLANKEIARKWGHILCGTILWTFSYLFLKDTVHIMIAPFIYTIGVTILNKLGSISDGREDGEIGDNKKAATLFGMGFLLLSVFAYINPEWWICYGLGVFSICFGDALAALVGRKYGKYSISLPNHKSLIGSIGFVIASIIGMIIVCLILRQNILAILPQIIVLSIIGSIVEVISGDWDNFLIQVVVGIMAIFII